MSMESKKSIGWTLILMILGMGAFYGGTEWSLWLIPAAVLVWYSAKPRLRGDRN